MKLKNYLNESSDKPVIPFIVGPTASGKTDMAIELAQELNTEIISADSMQIYKYMDIGTAKPTKEEQQRAKHHLIDFVEPDQNYSVANYYKDAITLINKFLEQNKTPVICGGTGLYINALSLPYSFSNNTNPEIRKELEKKSLTEEGKKQLYQELLQVDPQSAEKIHPNNIKRVIRALEIYKSTGSPKSELDKKGRKQELSYTPVLLTPDLTRETIYNRINLRVDKMINQGLIDEVRALDNRYDRNLISLQAIGYKEFFNYFDNKQTLEETIRILKRDTRHFAKRQLTWFRKDPRIIPVNY